MKRAGLAFVLGMAMLVAPKSTFSQEPVEVGEETFRLLVNYDLSIEEAVREGRHGWSNSDVNSENFKTNPTRRGKKELEMKYFQFNKQYVPWEGAIIEMKKWSYRPAELHELLAFGAKYSDEQRKYYIVALGSVWQDWNGYRNVAYLCSYADRRGLALFYDFDFRWLGGPRFLAVREEPPLS